MHYTNSNQESRGGFTQTGGIFDMPRSKPKAGNHMEIVELQRWPAFLLISEKAMTGLNKQVVSLNCW